MNKNEMVKNVKALAIPALKVTFTMNVDELNEAVRNVMFERFVGEVVLYSELCGVSPLESRKFAVDFIQNNDYVKNCLTATINLVLNGAFTKKWQLNDFIGKLLYVHIQRIVCECPKVDMCTEIIDMQMVEIELSRGPGCILSIESHAGAPDN